MTRSVIALLSAAVLSGGCATPSYDGHDLVPGVATEADIVGTMGKPVQTLKRPDGGEALYFSREPLRRQIFVADTAPDGRLRKIEQVLDYEHFKRIHAGTTTADQVKAILGPPSLIRRYPFKPLDVWQYPWRSASGDKRIFTVSVSSDGIVREVSDAHDPGDSVKY
jgi:hypothetical protein